MTQVKCVEGIKILFYCSTLEYNNSGALALFFAAFGQGTGQIWLDNVQCVGTEARLADCPANAIGSHNCVHFEDASVVCQPFVTEPPRKLRLQCQTHLTILSCEIQNAQMVTSDWWVAVLRWKDVWRFAIVDDGALSVMICGVMLMLMWLADSWDIVIQVSA